MIENNEILTLIMTAGVCVLVQLNKAYFRRIHLFSLLFSGFCFLFAAWTLSIIEGFVFPIICNFLEHLCYLLSCICLAVWLFVSPVTQLEHRQ